MTNDSQMRATPGDLRVAKFIALVGKYVLLPAAILAIVLKIAGIISWSWWLALLPSLLYVLHPIVIGVMGPILQYRRYRKAVSSKDTSAET